MRKTELISLIEAQWNSGQFKHLAREIAQNPQDIPVLLELNTHPTPRIAWRSAYLLDLAHDVDKTLLNPYLETLVKRVPQLNNQSIKRHYLRILCQHNLAELADGPLLNTCFEDLQTPETPIAVKAHCMQILYLLSTSYPELIPELTAVLEQLLPYGSKGEVNRAKKILAHIKT